MADFWDKVNQKNTSGNYSDDYWNKVAGSGYGLEPPEEPSSNPVRRLVADPLVGLAKGAAVGIPETIVGLLDIPTMGHAGKVAETVSRGLGLGDFKSANEMFDNLLTPETREAQLKVSEAKGFLPTIATAIQNPSSIVQTVAESIPSMVAGMRAAGAVSKLIGKPLVEAGVANLPRIAKVGGIAEGAITAGQNIEQVRQQTEEGTLTPSQVAINTLSGVLTGMIGVAGGRLAQRFGLEDVDTLFTGGRSGIVGDKEKGIFKKVLMGTFQEGVLEELPQSMQEQIAQNLALNKPIDDGVFEAGAMGMLAGFAQSTGANIAGSTMRKMKNELDPINQTIKKTVEETLAGELSAIGGWDNGKIDETIKQIPWQDFTLKGEPYQEGVTVGEPYGGEILRPVRPEKPESALDAEFQTIRRIEAPRKEERKILPPGQGFELVGEREKVNTGREIKEIKELQNNIAEREQYISRSEAFKGTEMYNKNVARLEEDKVKLQELTGTIPKTAEVEATSQDKQPWEMTASEFDETFGGTGRIGYGWIEKLGDGKITEKQYDEAVRLAKKNAAQVLPDIESTRQFNNQSADTHKGIIRNALSEGKPVPHEVLKNYPDLARRSEITPEAAPLLLLKTSIPVQKNTESEQNLVKERRIDSTQREKVSEMTNEEKVNELLKQKEVNRKTIQEMIKNGIITEDSIIRGTDIKYIKAIIKNNDTLPTGKDFEGNDVISASKYIPGNELPMYGGAGGNHVVMIGKSNLLEGKGEGINDWNIKPESPASDFNYIYKGKKYNYDDIKKILQKKTTDEEMMADKTARKVVRGIKNPKNLSELKQKQDQILLMREGKKKKTEKVKTVKTQPDKVSIPEIPETLNLVLHQMKSDVESGTAGGKQGVDEAGNTIYAKSGYMPWFSDLVKRYANEKTSPSGKKESISAKYLVNIINKGLKGDKLTPGQQGVWEEVNKIADHESGKTYAGLVNQFEKANAISKPTMADNLEAEGGILNDLNPSSGLFVNYSPEARATMPLGGNITTLDKTMGKPADETIIIYRGASEGRQGIVAGDYVTTNRQLAKDYAGKGIVTEKTVKLSDILDDKTEPLGEEYIYRPGATPGASAAELQKVVETGADYSAAETTKAGKQVTIPGASAAETFNLANPETEISKKLPEQATSKNADMFAEKESVKSEPKNFKEFVLSQGYEYPDSISKAQKPMEEFARVNKAKFKEENKTVADLTREFRGEEKQKTPEKTGDVEGFVADLNPMQKGRVISTLNVKTRYDGVVKTLREHVENLIAAGRKTTTKESIDENARSEAQQERSRILKDGNQNIKAARLKELDEIISNPPRKISYRLTAEDGSFYELNKTGYNYAKYLEGEHERANRETEWSKKLPEQATPKNADMFAIKNKGEKNEQPATMPSLADVQDVFKGQKVTQLENGFLINTKNGASLIVNAVDKITPSKVSLSIGYSKSGLSENEVIAGKYTSGKIELAKTAADKWTLSHESVHFMEDLGVINNNEVHLLKWYIQSLVKEGKFKTQNKNDIGGTEDRAEFLAQSLQKEPKGLSRIINKIQDFIDKLVNAFGIRTVRGIQRDVISGEIYNKETNAQKETRLDIEGGIEKGLNDLYEQEKKNKFSIKEGQPEKAKDDSGNRWWEDRDINAELKALPKEYWEGDVRDFIKEGYVPITRSEADELYKNKLDPFVSWVMLKGQETTGTEGLFMKPLTYKGYNPYYYETNTIRTDQEATELYQKYLHRYLGQTLSPAGRKDFIEKRMRDAADVWEKEAEDATPKTVGGIKEPWQMTRKEYDQFLTTEAEVFQDEIYNILQETNPDAWGRNDWGLRILPDRKKAYQEGDQLKSSYQWIDGNRTRKSLGGTSAIVVYENKILQAMRDAGIFKPPFGSGGYSGEKLALVRGDLARRGEDKGEGIFKDAQIIKIWNKNDLKFNDKFNGQHFKHIQQALNEGKTVSPEVLKDYPELPNPTRPPEVGGQSAKTEQYFIRPLDYISSYIPDSLSSWFKQTSTNSIPPADISQSNNTWKTPQKTLWDSFMYSIADRQIDLRDTQKSIDTFAKSIGKLISDTLNPSQKEQLFSSRLSKRVSDYATKEFRLVIEAMNHAGITTGQIEDYLHARHAEEANDYIRSLTDIKGFTEITNGKDKGKYTNENGHILSKSEYKELSEATIDESGRIINDADEVIGYQDGGSGMSSRDANDYLNSLNPATRQQYEKIALMVDKITHKNAQLLVDYGVESQDTIDKWFNKYKHYVPLFREDIEERPGTGRGFSVYGKASQMRKGSERKVVNILSNISMQRERYLTKGEKNRIDQALVFLEKEFPNEKFWTSYKIPDMKTYVPRGQKVETAGNVIIARILNKETGKIEHIALEFNSKDDRAMRMVKALKNMDMDTVGEVMGVLSKITRYVASINTQYNPVFGITNFFRDMGTAAFNLSTTPIAGKQKEVLQGAFPAIKGIYSALKGDRSSTEAKLFEEYQLEGGQVGYRNLWITSEDRAKEIEKELKSFQSGKPKRFLNKIARLLSDYNTTMENAVRLSAYKVGLESKDATGNPLMTREQAAVMAKNLTVNFNKKGQIAGQAGALYAFFNASVQGVVRMFETLRGPMGKKIIAGGIILGATQAMMLAAAGFKDEEPPEFVKERNIIIPIGGKKYLTFPMPLGFNAIPNVGRILAEITLGGGKNAGIKMSNLAGIIFEAFNPMGSSGWSMQTVAPTFLDPFAALAENKDWTGKPIYKEDFNALNPTPGTSRVKDSATVFGRGLAWAFNILTGGNKYTPGLFSPTPDQIDYLGGQITGGLGREIAKTSMMFESLYTGEELPAYKLPLTGRFYGTAEGQANESSKYYSNLKKLNIHEANIKGRIKDREPIGAYIKDNPEAKLWRMANKIENNISKIKKRKELAKTPDAKKTYDKLITLQMKRLNDMVEKIEK